MIVKLNTIGFFFILQFTLQNAISQNDCFCKADLEYYYSEIQKTVSYKDQIKGKRKEDFDVKYSDLKNKISCKETEFDCFALLNQLSYLIDDEHFRLRSVPKLLSSENFSEETTINAYLTSDEFLNFPKTSIALDSLERRLSNAPFHQLEGIYYKDGFKVGVFQPKGQTYYDGIVLKAPFPIWEKGQLVFRLHPSSKGNYYYHHAHFKDKRWLAISNEKFVDGRLIQLNWKKDTLQKDYFNLDDTSKSFEYKKIKEGISYIRLGSFGMQDSNRNEAAFFLNDLKNLKMEKNLILDLRNNSGGGDKVSKPFQKFIEKEFKEGKIYILVNIKTASNAEITTQRMRFSKNVKVLGHSSSGILSYGSNYGNRVVLPSGNYYYKVTDMNFSEFLAYEGVGIPVDIELNLNEDWIDQTVKLFHKE